MREAQQTASSYKKLNVKGASFVFVIVYAGKENA
jgi:hypothetical protein